MNEERLEAARQVMIRKEKFEAARQALFALEESLGPSGTTPRQEIFLLRIGLDQAEARLRNRAAAPWVATVLPMCDNCQNTGMVDAEVHGLVHCTCDIGRMLADSFNAKPSEGAAR